jgi:hypothetical protein
MDREACMVTVLFCGIVSGGKHGIKAFTFLNVIIVEEECI